MDNLNNNNFPRINRNQLISDSNLDVSGSVLEETQNPNKIFPGYSTFFLDSRIGDGGDVYTINKSTPVIGYCLRFDKNNQSAYIQTTIPSTEYSNYDIIIKGEGTVDILYPDHSSTNIAIKQKSAITDTTYFYLSYIVFRNKTTKKIEHLFECEESTGTVLYDAVTGDTATLESVTSVGYLRVNYPSKEWIKDESVNLVNRIDFSPDCGGCCYTTTTCLSGIPTRSYCMTLEFPEDYDATQTWVQLIGDNIYQNNAYWGNCISIDQNGRLYVRYGDGTIGGLSFGNAPYINKIFGEGDTTGDNKSIIRKGKYKCVFSVVILEPGSWSKVYVYVNGELKHTFSTNAIHTGNVAWASGCTLSMFTGGNTRSFLYGYPRDFNNGNTSYSTLVCGCYNVHVFSFEVNNSTSSYTVQDYQNDVIPEYDMEGLVFSSGNIEIAKYRNMPNGSSTIWGDRSINNNTMRIIGINPYSKSKCYGTWLNNVGYTKSGSLYIPRKVIA